MRHGSFPPLWWKQLDLFIALYSKDKDQSAQQEEEEEEEESKVNYKFLVGLKLTSCL
jgi:preprotein translocase subunit SecB